MHKHTGQFDPEWRCWTVFGRRSHSGVPGAGPASGVDAAGFGRVAAASVSIVVVDEPSSIRSMMGHSGFAMVVGAAEQRRLKQKISDTRSGGVRIGRCGKGTRGTGENPKVQERCVYTGQRPDVQSPLCFFFFDPFFFFGFWAFCLFSGPLKHGYFYTGQPPVSMARF